MIYCITQPLEQYNTKIMNFDMGLWKSYQNRPGIFALISLTTPLLYQWEEGSPVEPMDRIVRLEPGDEKKMEELLEADIHGLRLSQLLEKSQDPLEFFDKFRPEVIALSVKHPFYTPSQVDRIMKARVLSWVKFHKIPGWNNFEELYKEEEKEVRDNAYGR